MQTILFEPAGGSGFSLTGDFGLVAPHVTIGGQRAALVLVWTGKPNRQGFSYLLQAILKTLNLYAEEPQPPVSGPLGVLLAADRHLSDASGVYPYIWHVFSAEQERFTEFNILPEEVGDLPSGLYPYWVLCIIAQRLGLGTIRLDPRCDA